MFSLSKKEKKILILLVLLFVLVGCTKTTGTDGKTLPEKIIYTTTTFKEVISNENWFSAILVYPIAWLINIIATKTGAVVAVILATVLVNIIVLPLTIKSTVQQQKLQAIQPEIDAITEKYKGKDDQQSKLAQGQELQKIYNKYGVNPLSSLLGIFTTFPILIAMYQAVQRANAVCTGSFLGYSLEITPRVGFLVGGSTTIIAIIILILVVVSQFLSMNVPRWLAQGGNKNYGGKSATEDSQKVTNASMTFFIGLMSISMPTTMSVYWIVSSIVNIAKTIIIQKVFVEKGK